MKLKKLWQITKRHLVKTLRFPIFIGMAIGVILFFRWIGLKGFLGFVIGMTIMAWALLSKNQYLKWIIDLTDSDQYIWEIMKGEKNGKN